MLQDIQNRNWAEDVNAQQADCREYGDSHQWEGLLIAIVWHEIHPAVSSSNVGLPRPKLSVNP